MNFKQHITFGIVIGVGFSLIFLLYEGLSWLFIFPLLLAIFGSVLPDIDHHASIPFRTLKMLVFLFFFFSCLGIMSGHGEILNTITEKIFEIFPVSVSSGTIKFFIVILIAITVGILSVILLKIIKPAHRGITHKKMFGIFIGFLLFLFFYFVFSYQNFSVITTLSFIMGFFSHLALDKILFKM
ncbi:MAG: hypothetical protein CVT88_02350 [Candidatus Altiarchaeales archaeon HGW-Altiarchaeales-1]|nr:MAG: hypothetical protein CVT88_02350 [Candidatus Altiarchaeales archaeon HGW-Altiarchaeales-1]